MFFIYRKSFPNIRKTVCASDRARTERTVSVSATECDVRVWWLFHKQILIIIIMIICMNNTDRNHRGSHRWALNMYNSHQRLLFFCWCLPPEIFLSLSHTLRSVHAYANTNIYTIYVRRRSTTTTTEWYDMLMVLSDLVESRRMRRARHWIRARFCAACGWGCVFCIEYWLLMCVSVSVCACRRL